MNKLTTSLKKAGVKDLPRKSKEPMWAGPQSDAENGGITFSLLNRFLTCPERFRLRVMEGLKPVPNFNHRIEYGQMWHTCEEAFAKHPDYKGSMVEDRATWQYALREYSKKLCVKYRTQQEQINHWYNICKIQFPLYIEWWKKHADMKERQPLLQEEVFKVRYTLPSGRTVYLRGKWDSIDLVTKKPNAGVWIMETKTKGDIEEQKMQRQLSCDLQTMLYIVALQSYIQSEIKFSSDPVKGMSQRIINLLGNHREGGITGVRYNVIRRPLAGGKGSIKRKEPNKSNPQGETAEEFCARLGGIIKDGHGDTEQGKEWGLAKGQHYFFMRWNVRISQQDIIRFQQKSLNPLLERLCDWYEWVKNAQQLSGNPFEKQGCISNSVHWQHPFGAENTITEYGGSDLDEYLLTGSETGLVRNSGLFEELKV